VNGPVLAVALQPDGRVLIAGDFTAVGSSIRTRVARLNLDGSVDPAFIPPTDIDGAVNAIALQVNGKLVLGGDFTTVGGAGRNHIARLNTGGTLDAAFNPGTGTDGSVYAVALQADGRVVIGGDFTTVNGSPRRGVARLGGDTVTTLTASRFSLPIIGTQNVQLVLTTEPGATYVIDASVNLLNWIPLTTNTAAGSTLTYTDTNAPGFNVRFYRARRIGP